jgi:hypothetical protein
VIYDRILAAKALVDRGKAQLVLDYVIPIIVIRFSLKKGQKESRSTRIIFRSTGLLFEPIPGRVTPSTFDGQEGTVAHEAGDGGESQRYKGIAYAVISE